MKPRHPHHLLFGLVQLVLDCLAFLLDCLELLFDLAEFCLNRLVVLLLSRPRFDQKLENAGLLPYLLLQRLRRRLLVLSIPRLYAGELPGRLGWSCSAALGTHTSQSRHGCSTWTQLHDALALW